MRKALAIAVAAALLLSAPAGAQQNKRYPTPVNGAGNTDYAPGTVPMCLNASGFAVPCSDPTALPSGGGSVVNAPLTETNSTIAVTNTFQSALAANPARKSCTIQNQGANVMYGYASEANTPTIANSMKILPGAQYSCQGVGAVQIAGTAGDAYVVVRQ